MNSNPHQGLLPNEEQSPLLRLPTELRLYIWTLAYGNEEIHVFQSGQLRPATEQPTSSRTFGRPLRYTICQSRYTTQDICKLAEKELAVSNDAQVAENAEIAENAETGLKDTVTWNLQEDELLCRCSSCTLNPRVCWPEGLTDLGGRPVPAGGDDIPDFKIPVVCKQQWRECQEILYTTNTFSFFRPQDFHHWVNTARNLKRVRNLKLVINWTNWWGSIGTGPLRKRNLMRLPNIRSLRLSLWRTGSTIAYEPYGKGLFASLQLGYYNYPPSEYFRFSLAEEYRRQMYILLALKGLKEEGNREAFGCHKWGLKNEALSVCMHTKGTTKVYVGPATQIKAFLLGEFASPDPPAI